MRPGKWRVLRCRTEIWILLCRCGLCHDYMRVGCVSRSRQLAEGMFIMKGPALFVMCCYGGYGEEGRGWWHLAESVLGQRRLDPWLFNHSERRGHEVWAGGSLRGRHTPHSSHRMYTIIMKGFIILIAHCHYEGICRTRQQLIATRTSGLLLPVSVPT
jgi:hypothetical protein